MLPKFDRRLPSGALSLTPGRSEAISTLYPSRALWFGMPDEFHSFIPRAYVVPVVAAPIHLLVQVAREHLRRVCILLHSNPVGRSI